MFGSNLKLKTLKNTELRTLFSLRRETTKNSLPLLGLISTLPSKAVAMICSVGVGVAGFSVGGLGVKSDVKQL